MLSVETQIDQYMSEKPSPGLEPFVAEFLQDRKAEMKTLQELHGCRDMAGIKKIVHPWKGFSEPYGFKHLGEVAQQVEQAITDNVHCDLSELLVHLNDYLRVKEKQFTNE